MFNGEKPLVCIYLSRLGCLAYTQAMLTQLAAHKPILVVAKENADLFKDTHKLYTLNTAKTKVEHLIKSVTIQKVINELITDLKKELGPFELYFPAFHPWNINFLKAARKEKLSTTITIHDYKTHPGESSLIIENLQNRIIGLSSRSVFLTEYVKQQAIKELGDQEKFAVIPHPIINAHSTQALPHSAQPSLLFLGRGVAYKGLALLLTAIETLPIQKLTVAGAQKEKLSIDDPKINIIDKYLDEAEIGELLASHHILVLPYTEASQSGILTLGLSAGIPMVITKVGGLQEQLPHEAAVWVEPEVESLRAGIERLIKEPEMYRNLQTRLKTHRNKSQLDK